MSGLADVMAVFGFIDQAVVADPGLGPKVSAVLPGYDSGAAGWYQGVSEWIPSALRLVEKSGRAEGPGGAEPGGAEPETPRGIERGVGGPTATTSRMKEALTDFGDLSTGAELGEDDLVPHRLVALAALGRIWPSPAQAHSPLAQQLAGADVGLDDLVRALQPLTTDGDQATAGRLVSLFADDQEHPGQNWDSLLAEAADKGLVSPSVAHLQYAADSWTVKQTAVGLAVAFETHKRIVGVTLSDFDDLFVPPDWTNFSPPWCAMTAKAPYDGHDVYLEVLGTDCPPVLPLCLSTPLQFTVGPLPDATGTCLQYRLAPNWSAQGGDGLVSVDEGSIVVRAWEGAIHLITTKRIQFQALKGMPPLDAAWLAQLVWALGYSSLAEYFVNRVALHKPIQVTGGTGPGQNAHHSGTSVSVQLGKVLKKEVAECVDGIGSALGMVQQGSYGAKQYSDDLAKFVKHVAHYGSDLLGIASQLASGNPGQQQGSFTAGHGRYVSEPLVVTQPPSLANPVTGAAALACSVLQPGLMQPGPGSSSEMIGAQIVRCEPAQLGPGDKYRLVVEASALQLQPGGTYTGTVAAQTGPNAAAVRSDAWIVIP
jgi:hypothetical protein